MEQFFPEGDHPLLDPFAQRYLARLRVRAAGWSTDVTPSDTMAETMVDPVATSVRVPGLTGAGTTLWVLCHHRDGRHPGLSGGWGTAETVEVDQDPVRGIEVSGVPLTPEDLADLAAAWMERQLMADVYRDEWNRGRPSRRDAHGPVPPFRQGRRVLVRSVPERTAGRATRR